MAITVTNYTKPFTVESGKSVTVSVEAFATGGLTYTWTVGGVLYQSGSKNNHNFTTPVTDGQHTIRCTISEDGGGTTPVDITYTVENRQKFSPALNSPKVDGLDIRFDGIDFVQEETFTTAITLALFTDGRASDSDTLPTEHDEDPRGWWGDSILNMQTGSTAWLYAERGKLHKDTLLSVRSAYENALERHLIDTGMADTVSVTYELVDYDAVQWSIIIGVDRKGEVYINWKDRWDRTLNEAAQ